MCTIGRPAARKASSNWRMCGRACEVPAMGNPPPSSTSCCVSMMTSAEAPNSGAVWLPVTWPAGYRGGMGTKPEVRRDLRTPSPRAYTRAALVYRLFFHLVLRHLDPETSHELAKRALRTV